MSTSATRNFWTTDRIINSILVLAGTIILGLLINYLSNVLLPFFAACFIAYLLQPIVTFNQRWTKTKGRILASILTIIEVTSVVVLLMFIFLPSVIKEIDMLGNIIHNVSAGKSEAPAYHRLIIDVVERYLNPDVIKESLQNMHLDTLINRGSTLLEQSIDVVLDALGWLLTLIYIIFILVDYPQISRGFKLIIPHKYRDRVMVVVKEVQVNMNRYFRGQGVVALCAMVFYCIGFSIVGLPLAIPMGLLVGILYMIPYFQYVTLIPVAIICFIYSLGGEVGFFPELGKCVLVYVVSQSICDYIITPHIMGKEMGLNPAIILLSLSVWGSLLGIIGMIIALPVTALIMSYYERYISFPRQQNPQNQE